MLLSRHTMRRREFIAGLGSAATWPLVARAQQTTRPVVGWLGFGLPAFLPALRRGLSEFGFIEDRNLTVERLTVDGRLDQLSVLADDLVRRQVAVIFASNTPSALAAKLATRSIPIVFLSPSDPVESGLVANINRPGSNLTGVSSLNIAVAAKRFQLLHELVPSATAIAYLANPANPVNAEIETREMQEAARTLGVQLLVINARDPNEFDTAFATLAPRRAGALVVGSDPLFFSNSDRLVTSAASYKVPTMHPQREAAEAGGLVSYGPDFSEVWRQAGRYIGRILKGEKPADLPVQQVTKIELVINMKTAKSLGLVFPTALLVRAADEVIE
jgi:putative ABC transport system substrate-binding protein